MHARQRSVEAGPTTSGHAPAPLPTTPPARRGTTLAVQVLSPLSPFTARSRGPLGSASHPLLVTNENLTAHGNQTPSPAPAAAPSAHQQWARQGGDEGAPTSATDPWAQQAPDTGWNPGQFPAGAAPGGQGWSGAPTPDTSVAAANGVTPRPARRFGVGVLAAAAAVALIAGGVGGYAIGHTVAVSQLVDREGTTSNMVGPGTDNQQMGPGGPGQQGNNQQDGSQDGTGSGDGTGAQGVTPDGTGEGTGVGTGTSTEGGSAATGDPTPTVDA